MPFPQAWSLSGALQEAQLCLLGRVMGVCAPAEQVRMLDGLKNSVVGKAGKQQGRGDPQQLLQHGVATRASIAALSGLHTVVDRYKGMPPPPPPTDPHLPTRPCPRLPRSLSRRDDHAR